MRCRKRQSLSEGLFSEPATVTRENQAGHATTRNRLVLSCPSACSPACRTRFSSDPSEFSAPNTQYGEMCNGDSLLCLPSGTGVRKGLQSWLWPAAQASAVSRPILQALLML